MARNEAPYRANEESYFNDIKCVSSFTASDNANAVAGNEMEIGIALVVGA